MLFRWSGAIAVVFTVVYGLFGGAIIGLLTDSEETLAVARDYLMWAVAIPLCGFGAFTWDGIFIGLTRTRQMLISMATAMVVFFIFLQLPIPANHCLWVAFLAYLLARSVAQTILWRRVKNDFAE
jgi:MATE family multidrug resistance protein